MIDPENPSERNGADFSAEIPNEKTTPYLKRLIHELKSRAIARKMLKIAAAMSTLLAFHGAVSLAERDNSPKKLDRTNAERFSMGTLDEKNRNSDWWEH